MGMLILTRLASVTVHHPTLTGAVVPQDAVVSDILGFLLALPIVWCIGETSRRFRASGIVAWSDTFLGKWISRLIASVLITYWIVSAAITSRALADAYTTGVMPETPTAVFVITMAFLGACAASCGLEVIGRLSDSYLPAVLTMGVVVVVLAYSSMSLENLFPLFPYGLGTLVSRTPVALSRYMEFSVLWMIAPHRHSHDPVRRPEIWALLVSGIVTAVFSAAVVTVFGVTAGSLALPSFSLARQIRIGRYLERVEVLPLAVWSVTAGISIALFLWASSAAICELLHCGIQRWLPYVLGALAAVLGLTLFRNTDDMVRFEHTYWSLVPIILVTVLLAALIAADLLARKKAGKKEDRQP